MDPTQEQLKNRQLAVGGTSLGGTSFSNPNFSGVTSDGSFATGSPTTPQTISSSSLSSDTSSLILPSGGTPTDFRPATSASLEALLASFNAPTAEEATASDLQSQILKSIQALGGEKAKKGELEAAAGLPAQRQELQNVINQLQGLQKEAAAIPLQIAQEFGGRGVVKGIMEPKQAERLRENAIKSLGLAAIGETFIGNIALAEQNIQNALDAEFEPQQLKLDLLKQAYEFNKDALERVDKKRADTLNLIIGERNRLLEADRLEKEGIYNAGMEAARNGASQSEIQDIYNSRSRNEAISKASSFLSIKSISDLNQRDFENKIKLRNLEIDEAKLRLDQNKLAIEQAQKLFDIQNGVLDEKELKDVDDSPQGKRVKTLGDLRLKVTAYKSLIEQYGTASFGSQKAKLDAAYADLKIAYKTAAELGALTGPDVALLEEALRGATFSWAGSQIFSKITGSGRIGTIVANIDQASSIIEASGKINLEQLLARSPKYSNSSYVQTLALPFLNTKGTVKIQGKDVPIGTIIQNSAGQKGRIEADGSITPIQ